MLPSDERGYKWSTHLQRTCQLPPPELRLSLGMALHEVAGNCTHAHAEDKSFLYFLWIDRRGQHDYVAHRLSGVVTKTDWSRTLIMIGSVD